MEKSNSSSLIATSGDTQHPTEILSAFHGTLKQTLTNSKVLAPLFLEVHNESYWYYMRRRLGPRRHNSLQVKYNPSNLKFEAFIYDLKRREEDLEVVPKKVMVGGANSKWQAYKIGEQAMKERDKNRPIIPDDPNLLLNTAAQNINKQDLIGNTHFRIVVVSDAFKRVASIERFELVYKCMLSELGISVDRDRSDPFHCAPLRFKLSSTYGRNVCQFDLLRFIPPADKLGTVIQISALTPSQWRPDQYKPILSERMGQSHGIIQQMQIDTNVKPSKQKVRIKKLTTVSEKASTNSVVQPKASKNSLPIADSLGLDPAISGVQYEKLGGIYGHFFSDLSTDVREMVLNKYKDNKDLIRTVEKQSSSMEQKQNKGNYLTATKVVEEDDKSSFQPKTSLARLRSKLNVDGRKGDADSGTTSQDEMREEVLISNKRIEMVAIRVQRIRRAHMLIRAIKREWIRQYSAIIIQRSVRGQFGRRYAYMFSRLKPIAATRIQKFYRDLKRYCILKVWNYLSYRLTRIILPKIKLFIKNCFLCWIRKRHAKATIIQKVCRGRIARVRVYKIHGQKTFFRSLFYRGAVQLQKLIRGYLARRYYNEVHVPQKLFFIIVIPAVIRMQRIFRGRIAKKITARRRYELKCLLLLQKVIKAYVRRVWDEQKRIALLEKNSATTIQRHYRGLYDRKLYKLKYYFYWYDHIYIPTIVRLQSCIRCFHARRIVNLKRFATRSANTIQRAYRFYKRYLHGKEVLRKLLEARKNQNVILVQKHIRRFLYRKKYERMLLTYNGRVVFAAKIILRAWRSYKLNQKYQILLEDYRKETQEKLLKKYLLLRKDIKRDIKELRHDLTVSEKSEERYKGRLKELEKFLSQAEFRLNKIKSEMNKLEYEDFERGWAEALGQEYEFIAHQQLLAKEEIRLIRNKIMKIDREILQLNLELEETEMEFDDVDSFSNEMVEKARTVQLQRAERKASFYINKLIYRERVHWKIESNRVNKMKNLRHNFQAIIAESQSNRPFGYFTTVSYEQRKQRRDYEELVQQRRLQNEASDRDAKSKPKSYEEYAIPIQKVFDRLVENNLEHVRGFTLDDRAARLRDQQLANQMVAKRTQNGQFASLKEDFR